MSELDPSIDPNQLIDQETGQIADKDLAEIGAIKEKELRDMVGEEAAHGYPGNPRPPEEIAKDLEGWVDGGGDMAMHDEIGRRAVELLPPEVSKELLEKVREAAGESFYKKMMELRGKYQQEANAVAEEFIQKLNTL